MLMSGIKDKAMHALCLNSMMHVDANRRVEIENCKKIIEYNDICVRLKTNSCTVCIWGSNLCVDDFCTGGIVINGRISSIEFE